MHENAATSFEIGETVVVAGIRTNYHDIGSGDPVVLIHGSGPEVSALGQLAPCAALLVRTVPSGGRRCPGLRLPSASRPALPAPVTSRGRAALGLGAGLLLTDWFMSTYETQGYHWSLDIQATSPPLFAVGVLLAALAAQLPALRVIRRMDLARIVRERSL